MMINESNIFYDKEASIKHGSKARHARELCHDSGSKIIFKEREELEPRYSY